MSVIIKRSDYDQERWKKVVNELTFVPPIKFIGKKTANVPDPILCYKEDDTNVYLPFQYSRYNMKTINDSIASHQKIDINLSDFSIENIRTYQKDAVTQAIKCLNEDRTVLLYMRPGKGKTFITCQLISKVKFRTVVLVECSTLLEQWKCEIEATTDAKVWIIDNKKHPVGWDIAICLKDRWKKLTQDERDSIGCLVIDECHTFCNRTGKDSILSFQPKFIISCSATPKRTSDGMHVILESIIGTTKVVVPDHQEYQVLTINTHFLPEVKKVGKITNWTIYYQSLLNNSERNEWMVDTMIDLVKKGNKILAFTNENDHCKHISQLIQNRNQVSSDYLCEDKKNYIDCDILVGTIQKCGTGFDEMNYCKPRPEKRINLVFYMITVKDISLKIQCNGRAERSDNPIIVNVIDDGKLSKKHYESSMQIYKGVENRKISKWQLRLQDCQVEKLLITSEDTEMKRTQKVTIYTSNINPLCINSIGK